MADTAWTRALATITGSSPTAAVAGGGVAPVSISFNAYWLDHKRLPTPSGSAIRWSSLRTLPEVITYFSRQFHAIVDFGKGSATDPTGWARLAQRAGLAHGRGKIELSKGPPSASTVQTFMQLAKGIDEDVAELLPKVPAPNRTSPPSLTVTDGPGSLQVGSTDPDYLFRNKKTFFQSAGVPLLALGALLFFSGSLGKPKRKGPSLGGLHRL